MSATYSLSIGEILTRDEIHQRLGGSKQSYLPTKNGIVVCGCFDANLNKRAPREIDVGNGPIVVATALKLANEQGVIPVFLKKATNKWEFAGKFKAVEFSTNPDDIFAYSNRRTDAVGVLFLQEVDDAYLASLSLNVDDQFAIEGNISLRQHLVRERSQYLSALKKSEAIEKNGWLVCEACGFSSQNLPPAISSGAFETHHIVPLSKAMSEIKTRINDLSLLCANCHRMIHKTSPLLSINDFSQLLSREIV